LQSRNKEVNNYDTTLPPDVTERLSKVSKKKRLQRPRWWSHCARARVYWGI